ncbi:MAG: 5-formyltetrahydrofolate cyclo-ligase [Pseudonocardiaceae bacterium]|nr:5-formyltetrahydrofolate cyclo-ligase [Pseudonocardiaceae bacterium]
MRRSIEAARRALPDAVREAEAASLTVATTLLMVPGQTVCAYYPLASEPASPAALEVLRSTGCRVLLPVVGADAGPLDWAVHDGEMRSGPLGLLEPAGPRLGPDAVGGAELVLVPALAVSRDGVRLGRGGGHYDRTLPLAHAGVPLVALIRDEELLDTVPAEPHDVRVTAVLTPGAGLVPLQ